MNIILLRQAEKTVLASLEYAKMLKKNRGRPYWLTGFVRRMP